MALIGGLAVGMAIAALLVGGCGTFCPVCGGKLAAKDETVVCTSCGVRLRFGGL